MNPQKSSTIDDVAAEANVSVATVSRALRGLPNVAESTRRRIEEVAERLRYQPDPSASRLASGKSSTVAIIVPTLEGWYFSTVMAASTTALTKGGYESLIIVDAVDDSAGRLVDRSVLKGVDGVILINMALSDSKRETLQRSAIPVVSIGMKIEGFSAVSIDDVALGFEATSHLAGLGHKTVGVITGLKWNPFQFEVSDRRLAGHMAARSHFSLVKDDDLVVGGDFSMVGGYNAMLKLMERPERPSALLAFSDEMACGAWLAARSLGLSVPEDISIIGVDDHPMSELWGLTTIAQNVTSHGGLAAELLLKLLKESDDVGDIEVETTLIQRSSTRVV